MEAATTQKLVDAGIDVEAALDRFMKNEELLMRFLRKFSQDENYGLFHSAMLEKRYEDAFNAAHSFKGLCGNLSLIRLYDIISKEVEYLRGNTYDQAEELLSQIQEEYDKVIEVLNTL